jgi:hypothetical protein
MDEPGEYKVVASFPELPSLASLEFTAQCTNLPVTSSNLDDLNEIVEEALPLVSVVQQGNGQIGSAGEQLRPLTVAMYNRFGKTPISSRELIDKLQTWYSSRYFGQVPEVKVSFTLEAHFDVIEGDATVLKSGTATGGRSLTYPLTSNQGNHEAIVVFGNNPINPVNIRAYVTGSYSIEWVDASGAVVTTPSLPSSSYTVIPALFFLGPPEVRLVEQNEAGEFVEAEMILPWSVLDNPDPTTAPRYFLEARLPLNEPLTTTGGVKALSDCRNEVAEIPGNIAPVGIQGIELRRDFSQKASERYLLYHSALPLVFITQTLSLDEVKPDLPTDIISVQTKGFAKFVAFAQEPIEGKKPVVNFLSTSVHGEGKKKFISATLTSLEALRGFDSKNYVYTQKQPREHHLPWDVMLSNVTSKETTLLPVTLKYKRGPELGEIHVADIGFVFGTTFSILGFSHDLCLIDGAEPTPTPYIIKPWSRNPDRSLNKGLLAISGVQQGDKIGVSVKIKDRTYFDQIAVVKGFTWNDYQRLKDKTPSGKPVLTFAPKLQALPDAIKQNIITTIEFALEPPTDSPDWPNDQKPAMPTQQEQQRKELRKQIEADIVNLRKQWANLLQREITQTPNLLQLLQDNLATFRVPSAMAVEEFTKDDMHHLHWVVTGSIDNIGISNLHLIANTKNVAKRVDPTYPLSQVYKKGYEFDDIHRKIMVEHYKEILQPTFVGYPPNEFFAYELENYKDIASLLGKLKNGSDTISSYLIQIMKDHPEVPKFSAFITQLAAYDEATDPSKALKDALDMALNQLIQLKPSFYNESVFASVVLTEETRRLLEQNPQEGENFRLLHRFLLEDAYPDEIVRFSEKSGEVGGFIIRQSKLAKQSVMDNNHPFAIYHTYERRSDRADDKNNWRWGDYYISPQAVNDHQTFFGGDPVRNIRTDLVDNRPTLFLAFKPTSAHSIPFKNVDEVGSVLFFVNRKGQIVICPEVSTPDHSLLEPLQVADAVDEVDW